MAKYRKKPVIIDVVTFEEFVEFAKENSESPHWSFDCNGYAVTHENDECYLIQTLEGTMRFTPEDVLITGVEGEIYPCKIDIFKKTYEPVN